MCGRYSHRNADPPRFNIAPGTDCVVIRRGPDGSPVPASLHWGFAPYWLKDPSKAQINARAETVHERPMFRTAFRKTRCLVPADGWYEWARDGDRRQPWYFSMADETPFAFAGLWTGNTFAIMTTAASAFAARIHARMPVLLRQKDWDEWLDEHPQGPGRLQFLCRTWQSAPLTAWPVSTLVNKPQHDAPDCVEPTGEPLGD